MITLLSSGRNFLRYMLIHARTLSALVALSVGFCSTQLLVHADTPVGDGIIDRTAAEKLLESALASQQASEKAEEAARLYLNEVKAERVGAEKAAAAAMAIELKIEKHGVVGSEGKHPRLKLLAVATIGGLAVTGTALGIAALARGRGPSNTSFVNSPTFLQTIRGLQLNRAPGLAGPAGPAGRNGANGLMGLAGTPGRNGVSGLIGLTGAPGRNGLIGASGVNNGVPGPAGLPGTAGSVGPVGATGAPGPQGPQGIQGPQGPQGPAGPS